MAPVGAYDDDYLKWNDEKYSNEDGNKVLKTYSFLIWEMNKTINLFFLKFDVSFDGFDYPSNEEALKQKLHEMEKDQEEMSDSLMSLMSHFAKVFHL